MAPPELRDGLKKILEKKARENELGWVRENLEADRFGEQSSAFRSWLVRRELIAALPAIGKFVVGVATVVGVVVACMPK